MNSLPFRQIHLDFHTSPAIPDVGRDFEPEKFAQTLAEARVNSVTIFAKGHHGCSYYETKVGTKHPSLKGELLGPMIEACHKRGIRAPIYYSVMYDEILAETRPEWLLRREDSSNRPPLEAGYRVLCMNQPEYEDICAAATEEIVTGYDVDGMFYDIVFTLPCWCNRCLADLVRAGRDPRSREDHLAHQTEVRERFFDRMNAIIREKRPNASIYYNSLHPFQWATFLDRMTHLEIECLPRGGWGYEFFPIAVRRASVYRRPMLAMTGRFLENWGHFGSLSPRASLEYECFSGLAHGCACSIGDQLHPRGRLDAPVYELIGSVYEQVEMKEPWCRDSEPIAEIAVLSCNGDGHHPSGIPEGDRGAMKMLSQQHYQFEFIDSGCKFTPYRAIVIPDELSCDGPLAEKLDEYVQAGGRILLSHKAGLRQDGKGFALDCLPATLTGDAPHSPDYIVPVGEWASGLPKMPLVAYERAAAVQERKEARVLAVATDPYFDRTWQHFCSHFHTPPAYETDRPVILEGEGVVYFAHPIFTSYHRHGFLVYRDMVTRCLDRLLGRRIVQSNLPSTAHVNLMKQKNRKVLHVLHYLPERRTPRFEIVEDVIPLLSRSFSIEVDSCPDSVYLAPSRQELDFNYEDGRVCFTIPEIAGHAMAVME